MTVNLFAFFENSPLACLKIRYVVFPSVFIVSKVSYSHYQEPHHRPSTENIYIYMCVCESVFIVVFIVYMCVQVSL